MFNFLFSAMRKYISLIAIAIMAAMATVSCSKAASIPSDIFDQKVEEPTVAVFSIDLRFDAGESVGESATVEFLDENGTFINSVNIALPDESQVVPCAFSAESRPVYLYTEGLENADANGYLSIPDQSVETKAGHEALLVKIRR